MDENDPRSRIALALDVPDLESATALIEQTREHVGTFKVGLELYTAVGPAAVEAVHAAGAECFLDLKLHDIPATMGRSVARAASMGVAYLTVHGMAGHESLHQASVNAGSTRLLAVTVLTSLDAAALQAIGLAGGAARRSGQAGEAGLGCWAPGLRRLRARVRGLARHARGRGLSRDARNSTRRRRRRGSETRDDPGGRHRSRRRPPRRRTTDS